MSALAPAFKAVQTPEGVWLHLEVARPGDRLAALALDFGLLTLCSIALVLLVIFAGGGSEGALAQTVLLVALFLLRSFYFPFFELRWRGQTPGKRALRIRVVDREGGPLRARAVVARNLLRELELFSPLAVVAAPDAFSGGAPAWMGWVAGFWVLGCASLPFWNRERLRAGDLVAGTVVVRAQPLQLLDDLGQVQRRALFTFTAEQLDVYGAYELQTLEALLRLGDQGNNHAALAAVAERIQRRIGWEAGEAAVKPADFLRDFYAAQRARLEQRLLFGERRERKRGQP